MSRVNISLNGTSLNLNTDSSSRIVLSGTVDTVKIDAIDYSDINAANLICDSATIEVSVGSLVWWISVRKMLIASATGRSRIEYYGSPELTSSIDGFSFITQVSPTLPR